MMREAWQREYYLLASVVIVTFMGFDFSTPFLPLFVRELGDFSPEEAAFWSGIVLGVAPLLSAATGPFWGAVADRVGKKITIARAIIFYVVLQFLIARVTDIWQLVILRSMMGMMGGFSPLILSLAIQRAPRERTGQIIGTMQFCNFLPLAIGPIFGGVLVDTVGIRANFDLAAIFCLIGLGILWFVERDQVRPASETRSRDVPRIGFWATLGLPGVGAAMFVLFLAQYADKLFTPLLPIFVELLGVGIDAIASTAGIGLASASAATAISGWVYGRLSTRFGAARLLAFSLGCGAILAIPVALTQDVWTFIALRTLMALLAGGSISMAYTLAARSAPPERSATVLTALGSMGSAGNACGPLIGGTIASFSIRGALAFNAITYLVALGVALRRKQN
jgi:DHA1 family multidrug resistance protein-like MFS transporter